MSTNIKELYEDLDLHPIPFVINPGYRICAFEDINVLGLMFTSSDLSDEDFKTAWSELLIVAVQSHYKKVVVVGKSCQSLMPDACHWLHDVWLSRLQKTLVSRMKVALVCDELINKPGASKLLKYQTAYGETFTSFNTERAAIYWLKNLHI